MNARLKRRGGAAALLVALAPWYLGCATEVHLQQAPTVEPVSGTGRLLVRVFDTRSAWKRDIATKKTVITELYRIKAKQKELVREERNARWTIAQLPPGEYLLKVDRMVRKNGTVQDLATPRHKKCVIRANETTTADVVLTDPEHYWVGLAIVGTLGVIGGLGFALGWWSPFSFHLQ
jgi:hypothetical protein